MNRRGFLKSLAISVSAPQVVAVALEAFAKIPQVWTYHGFGRRFHDSEIVHLDAMREAEGILVFTAHREPTWEYIGGTVNVVENNVFKPDYTFDYACFGGRPA